jgi:hypothetical protein
VTDERAEQNFSAIQAREKNEVNFFHGGLVVLSVEAKDVNVGVRGQDYAVALIGAEL